MAPPKPGGKAKKGTKKMFPLCFCFVKFQFLGFL
jgi:hypothetical protein